MSTDNTQEDYDENTSAGIYGNGLDHPDDKQPATPAQHTPTPWVIERNGDSWLDIYAEYIPHGRVAIVAQQFPQDDGRRCRAMEAANAAFIVRACNNHARLVATLERIATYDAPDAHAMINQARAALSAAKE